MKKVMILLLAFTLVFCPSCWNVNSISKQYVMLDTTNISYNNGNKAIKNIALNEASSSVKTAPSEPQKSISVSKCETIADLAGTGFNLSKITGIGYQAGTFDKDQYVVVTVDGKKGLIDYNGKIVVPIIYKKISVCFHGIVADEYEYTFDLKERHLHGGHGLEHSSYYWDKITETMYEYCYDYYPACLSEKQNDFSYPVQSAVFYGYHKDGNDQFAPKVLIGRYGFVKNGKLTISLQYSSVHYFSDGLAAVKKDGLWGYINESGKVVIPFQYDDLYEANINLKEITHDEEIPYNFADGYVAVCKGGKWGYIDKTGKEIIPFIYTRAIMPYQGKAWVYNTNGNWIVIDLNEQL